MQFDADQRRAALLAFMARTQLDNVSRWESTAGLGEGTLRKFMAKKSKTLTDKSYQALANAAGEILGRPVEVAELQGNLPATNPVAGAADHNRVNSELHSRNALETSPQPLIIYFSVPGLVRGGNTLIYKDKQVGEVERIKRLGYAADAFCIQATDDLMSPFARTRDTMIIDPARIPAAADECIFVKDSAANPLDCVARHLVKITAAAWIVSEHNGRKSDYELPRSEFPQAWPIVGIIKS